MFTCHSLQQKEKAFKTLSKKLCENCVNPLSCAYCAKLSAYLKELKGDGEKND
jgi:nitrate reductase beta subunit